MKISGTGPLRSAPIRRREQVRRPSRSGFSGALNEEPPVHGAAGTVGMGEVSSLLAIQEVQEFGDERRRGLRRGEDILERLDELRHGLLIGAFPRDKLDQLVALVRGQHDRTSDPRLLEVLREIELRAMVELAKLGHVD